MKKFLFIGLGSIGQRHLRNIKKIYPKSIIYAYRRKNSAPLLDNYNKALSSEIENKFDIKKISNLSNIEKLDIDAGFICSPTSKHCDDASILIKKNIHCFIEKPIDSSVGKAKRLASLVHKKKVITMVGFNFKFNPLLLFIKKFLNKKSLGHPLFVESSLGEHVDDFHSYESYKNSYTSIKKLGGGVVLSQIHDLDNLLYLFNDYKLEKFKSFTSKISSLKIDVEDILVSIFKFKKNKNEILCSLNLNFFERPKNRRLKIIFEYGKIEANFNSKEIKIFKKNKFKVKKFKYDRNDIYMKEIKYFLSCIYNKKKVNYPLSLDSSIKTLILSTRLKK